MNNKDSLEKIKDDWYEMIFETEGGEQKIIKLHPYLIGKYFLNLEQTREILGHTNLRATLDYVHGIEDPHFQFIRDIIKRDSFRK